MNSEDNTKGVRLNKIKDTDFRIICQLNHFKADIEYKVFILSLSQEKDPYLNQVTLVTCPDLSVQASHKSQSIF